MSAGSDIKYKRILLKFSGEALMGEQNFGIDPAVLKRIAAEVKGPKEISMNFSQ